MNGRFLAPSEGSLPPAVKVGRYPPAVASEALSEWRGGRADRLDRLLAARRRISARSPSGRHETEQQLGDRPPSRNDMVNVRCGV